MPKFPSTLSKVALTAEERREASEITRQYHGELKWAWNKAMVFAFPLSLITTHLIYRYGKKVEGITNRASD
mgnify:CR=1 FL=1